MPKIKFIFSKPVIIIITLMLLSFPGKNVYSLESSFEKHFEDKDLVFTLFGGMAQPIGDFSDYLNTGFSGGISAMVPVFSLVPSLAIEIGASYSSLTMTSSQDSTLGYFTGYIGPVYYFQIAEYFQPFAGLFYKGSLFEFSGSQSGSALSFFKSSGAARIGFFIPFRNGMGIKIGADYTLTSISDTAFQEVSVFGGFSFNLGKYRRFISGLNEISTERNLNQILDEAVIYYKKNNLALSASLFHEALKIDKKNKTATTYLSKIAAWEKLKEANDKIAAGEHYEAIPILVTAAEILPEAEETLKTLRLNMQGKLTEMEKKGIDAFEKQNYDLCSDVMNKILLIDPKNKTARIYLPRAQKRQQAYKSLE